MAAPRLVLALLLALAGHAAAQYICLPPDSVCGSDGVTYGCPGDAQDNGITSFTQGACPATCPASSTVLAVANQCQCNSGLVCAGSTNCFRTLSGEDTFAQACTTCACIAPVSCTAATLDSNGDCLCAPGATCNAAVAPCGTKTVGNQSLAFYRPDSSIVSACVSGTTLAPTTTASAGCTADAECGSPALYCTANRACLACSRCATFRDGISGVCPPCPTQAPTTAPADICAGFLTNSSCSAPCVWTGVCFTPTTTTTTTSTASTSTTTMTTTTMATTTTTVTTTTRLSTTTTTTVTFPASCGVGQFQSAPGRSPCQPWTLCTTITVAAPTASSDRICGTTTMVALPPPATWFATVKVTRLAVTGVFDARAQNAFVAAVTQIVRPYLLLSLSIGALQATGSRRRALFYSFDYIAQINATSSARALAQALSNNTALPPILASVGPQYGTPIFSNTFISSAVVGRVIDAGGGNPLQTTTPSTTSSSSNFSTLNAVLIALAALAMVVALIMLLLYLRRRRSARAYERVAKMREEQAASAAASSQPRGGGAGRGSAAALRVTDVDETNETRLDAAALMPGRSFRTLGSYRATDKRESRPILRAQGARATVWRKGDQPGAAVAPAGRIAEAPSKEEFDSVRMVRPPREAASAYVDVADPSAVLHEPAPYFDVADPAPYLDVGSTAPYLAVGGSVPLRPPGGALMTFSGNRGSISVVDDDPAAMSNVTANVTRF